MARRPGIPHAVQAVPAHAPPALRSLPWVTLSALIALLGPLGGCDGGIPVDLTPRGIRLTEIMPRNDGAWLDEAGEAEDWIELEHMGTEPISLSRYVLEDRSGRHPLPDIELAPGDIIVLAADGEVEQGALHLPFRLSGDGETLTLWQHSARGLEEVERVQWRDARPNDALRPNASGEWGPCAWASPGRPNPSECGPLPSPPPPPLPVYEEYVWDAPAWPRGVVLSELALRPAEFVELRNTTDAPLSVEGWSIGIAPHGPGRPWPASRDGASIPLSGALAPGEIRVVDLSADDVAALAADPRFEGVVTLFDAEGARRDRVDFMQWPLGSPGSPGSPDVNAPTPLAREEGVGRWRFASATTRGTPNDAGWLPRREVGAFVRRLATPGDFAALSEGATERTLRSLKVISDTGVDGGGGPLTYFFSGATYALHYDFYRAIFEGLEPLDRCDPEEDREHRDGWGAFSRAEYFCGRLFVPELYSCTDEERRFLLGTLVHHVGVDLHTIEAAAGDRASPEQLRATFFEAARRTDTPSRYFMRPQSDAHRTKLRSIEGTLPIIATDAPFVGVTFQALNPGVAYGMLRFIPGAELATASLGPRVIALTDSVPNDVAFVGGLITEALQTPLAHVNVLSQNRGTPNMALAGARQDPRIRPLLETLVRLEVTGGAFTIRAADAAEASAFWESLRPPGPALLPALDLSARGIVSLDELGFADAAKVGAKAAQFAELYRVELFENCDLQVSVPPGALAIPLVHDVEHREASGAAAILTGALADPRFDTDAAYRRERLSAAREAILTHPVDASLLDDLRARIESSWGTARVRLRSSSNTEDLEGFNGAGLYESHGALVSDEGEVEDALRRVWASLFSERAHDERAFFRIDPSRVAMGVLVHAAFTSEEASGIVVSRSIVDPTRGDIYSFNVQRGEASVANPAPGIASELADYRWNRTPRRIFRTYSTFSPDASILSDDEACSVANATLAVHRHFASIVDPEGALEYFAMELEFKLADETREIFIKQARPYPFAAASLPADCRGF